MKVLVVYDSVSKSKATKAVAEVIGATLKEKGLEVDTSYCVGLDKSVVPGYDVVIAGAPTMAFRPSKDMGQFLGNLKGMDFKGKRAAGFDTQTQGRITGNAAKGIEEKLGELGFTIFKPHLVVYVQGKGKGEWEHKPGELDKAKAWAQEAAAALS